MRTPFIRPIRKPLWIAGIAVCLLAASGTVAIVGSIPASYASIPDEDAPSHGAVAPRGSENARVSDPQANAAITQASINRRNPAWCPACGVVESMREIEPSGEVGRQELTIRFRDGGTIVLNEATRRSWRLGNRVIVIGGLNTPGR
jgi:hypothetical protein